MGLMLVVISLSVFLSLCGCQPEQKAPTPQVPVVEVAAVTQQDVPIYKEWVGVMDGSINAIIRSQVPGYLLRQNYREGEKVTKGQVLFEIDQRTFQAAVNQYKASLDQAKADLARQEAASFTSRADLARVRPLSEKNAVSKKDLDDAIGRDMASRASVEAAKAAIMVASANLEKAELDLGFTKITSPIDGIAGIAKTQIGNLVGPNMQEELTTVSALDPIKVYINISEREYLQSAGAEKNVAQIPLELILADDKVYPEKGHFVLADRQVDPTTGTLKLGTLFPNKGNFLRPGQYGRIRAMIDFKKGALLIPQRAVTEVQGKYLVAVVVADNKINVRPVQVGERIGSNWLIVKGLQPGEQVVVEGTQKVKPGMTVVPRPFSPQPETAPAEKR